MPPKDKQYNVSDLPAENGIRLNNALLTVLILVSAAFGTSLLTTLNALATDVSEMKVSDGQTAVEFKNIKSHMDECKKLHAEQARRLRELEIKTGYTTTRVTGG